MNTAGKDFFNRDFFNNHIVAIGEYLLENLKWYSDMPDAEMDHYLAHNIIPDNLKEKAQNILKTFDGEFLTIPTLGENKVKHHYEKILWLIHEYCLQGWNNPVKAINLLDNNDLIIHPGTNRCAAAQFLRCPTMPVMINLHRTQNLAQNLENFEIIDNEKDLRQSLKSNGDILWRTESTENLYVNGVRQKKQTFQDFTFEFTHQDSWPDSNLLNDWCSVVEQFLPLQIFVSDNEIAKSIEQNCSGIVGKRFQNRNKGNFTNIDYEIKQRNHKVNLNLPWIEINNLSKINFNIFDLLFLVNPYYKQISSLDKSIVINNPYGTIEDVVPTIPDHYVRF